MHIWMPVKVDYSKCNGCRKCYNLCPMDVYTWDEGVDVPRVTYYMECWFCGACMMECPKRAIDVRYPLASW